MPFDIEDHSWTIWSSRNNSELSYQLWLSGFKELYAGAILNAPMIEARYRLEQEKYYSEFTEFTVQETNKKYSDLMYRAVIPAFWYVNEKYHLALLLDYRPKYGDECTLFSHVIPKLGSEPYPYINLRFNKLFPKDKNNNSIIPETMMYDGKEHTTFDVFLTNIYPDLIIDAYNSFGDMINYARVKKK